MDIIRLLPDAIANQIAAGEVIQRPASVVKELIENSIDAQSQDISVIVKTAGKTLIQVVDNGMGMSETDARMCFERHATSKIREAKDLFSIETKGFRGEAMASIGAVAHVELKTRREEDELATRILIANSKVEKQEFVQNPVGTSIAVKNLFFNVPARRNFLKSDPVELKHILEEFQRIAIAHPKIHFRFFNNEEEIFHLPPANLRQRIVAVFGKNINEHLVPIQEETDIVNLKGFISKPGYSKRTRGEQYFFVNNRFIKSAYFNHAIKAVYESLLPEGQHPLYVIFLTIDPAQIDINVHPTKQEIKFQEERIIYNIVKVSAKHALGQFHATTTLDFDRDPGLERMAQPSMQNSGAYGSGNQNISDNWRKMYEGLDQIGGNPTQADPLNPMGQQAYTEESLFDAADEVRHKDPTQLLYSYIFAQIRSGFLLIDQQAAHERILYERYMEQLNDGECSVQKELFPLTLELSPSDALILNQMMDSVQLLGFDIQEFGGNTFVLHGTPAHLSGDINHEQVIQNLLEQFKQRLQMKLDPQEHIATAMAISTAHRRGKSLSKEEMNELIDQLFATKMPYKSPTGRNCFITFDKSKLDRLFLG